MKTVDQWFEAYGESHKNSTNKTIHWICIPLIVISLVGLIWSIPVPQLFRDLTPAIVEGGKPILNWGTLFVIGATIYYIILSPKLAIGMLLIVSSFLVAVIGLESMSSILPLWASSLIIFAGAWVGQFIGHKIEGKKPSFFEDIQFLMIGPLWLLGHIYRKWNISY